MGAWGHKLYDSDVACDVRDAFKDLSKLPLDGAGLIDLALARHPNAADPEDEDHTVFWLALADQFHRYAIAWPPLFDKARALVDSGHDDRVMAALEMDERDRRKRAQNLAELREGWAAPHPKPKKRHLLAGPERHYVAPGEIWAYPTEQGNPPNTFFSKAQLAERFHPDGWNAFAVGAVGHQLGFFALAYVIRLHVETRDKPDLETCRDAPVTGIQYFLADKEAPLAHAVCWAVVNKSILDKMGAQRLGRLDLSWERIQARLNGTDDISASGRGNVSGYLHIYWEKWDDDWKADGFGDYGIPLDIRLRDLLR